MVAMPSANSVGEKNAYFFQSQTRTNHPPRNNNPWAMDNNCVKYHCHPSCPWKVIAGQMTHPWVMDNNCAKYLPSPSYPWKDMARKQFFAICEPWPWPWRYDPESSLWSNCVKYPDLTWILPMRAPSPWLWIYDLESHPWVIDNINQNQYGSKEF